MNATARRAVKIVLAVVGLGVLGFALANLRLYSADLPPVFEQGRMQGALISENIVTLSNQISTDLAKVNELDKNGQPREALDLTLEIQSRIQEVRMQANDLSNELKNMVGGLDRIKSPEAKQAALDAITNRMALISRLLSYSQYLQELLEVLSNRFTGTTDTRSVSNIISQINAEVTAVNNFNHQAGQAMERFDAVLRAE